jgi:hypothetical protein
MGSVAAGLASVGGSLAQAQELQRKEKIEQIKLALDQARVAEEEQRTALERGRLGIEQQTAGIAGQREKREQAEFEEKMRVARLPKFVGFRTVGGRLYAGLQNPDGTLTTKEITGVDSAKDAQALEEAIQALPPDAQGPARAAIRPDIEADDLVSARRRLGVISQKYAMSQLPGQTTYTDTTETHQLDTPQGPKLVQVPKHTVQHKGPAAQTMSKGGGGEVTRRGGGEQPSAPKSPAQIAKDLGLPPGSKVIGTKPPSRTEISKVIDPVGEADKRYKIMLDAVAHPNPQNDVALTFNHIGMTLSAQKGARVTNSEIQRAITARSLPEDLMAKWDSVVKGTFLSIPERQNMLALGKLNREFIWQQAWEKAVAEKMANYMPKTLPGLPPISGVHYIGEDVPLRTGGKARVVEIHPDGSIEVKPY